MGPTLEFYALVSAELQRSDLGLWNGSDSYKQNSANIADVVKSTSVTLHIDESQDTSSPLGDITITTTTTTTTAAINTTESPNTTSTRNSSRNNRESLGVATRSSLVATNNTINNQQQQQQHSPQMAEDALDMLIEQQGDLIDQQHSSADPSMPLLENPIAITTSPTAPSHNVTVTYVNAAHGLFPLPLGKSSKVPQVAKVRWKFKFLGKFMAKAVMDSRMVGAFFSSLFNMQPDF